MAIPPDPEPTSPASLPRLVLELRDLVLAYLRQETVTPLKSLGRYIAFGLAGAVLLGIGVVLLAVGALRLLQAETGDTFQGDWSWAPYGIVVAGMLLGGAATWTARGAGRVRA
jgi:hypothetical protein